jgi:hypothetical protein
MKTYSLIEEYGLDDDQSVICFLQKNHYGYAYSIVTTLTMDKSTARYTLKLKDEDVMYMALKYPNLKIKSIS